MPTPCRPDRRVIAWVVSQLEGLRPSEVPDGWELIELVGGEYDGLHFVVPCDRPLGFQIVLPVSRADEHGTAAYVLYLMRPGDERADRCRELVLSAMEQQEYFG